MYLKQLAALAAVALLVWPAQAQYREATPAEEGEKVVLTLEDALKVALDENTSVKVADLEIRRQEYARKGSYASLLPQVNASGSFQRTIRKQVMYMGGSSGDDGEGSSSGGGMASMYSSILEPVMYYIDQLVAQHPGAIVPYVPQPSEDTSSSDNGFEVGRSNTFNVGINASLPLVNAQLWESLRLSGDQVELAVEQARESRLGTVASVKQAYFAILLAKEAHAVYNSVFENALENFRLTEMRYNAAKASELDYTRAKSNVAAAIPNLYNAENSVELALWQLKAVMGVDLDMNLDVAGTLADYAGAMFHDVQEGEEASLDGNTQLRQLARQAEMLSRQIRMQQYAYLPTLSLAFAYSYNAMTEDFDFRNYRWTPYSYVGLSLSIPVFSGGQRYQAVRQARVQADELALQRENAERQIRIGIRQSLGTMETAMRSYDAARDALGSAEKAYDIAVKSYQLGKSTLTDLNNTELVLTQSRLAVSQAIYNFVIAKAGLEQTLGYDFNDK